MVERVSPETPIQFSLVEGGPFHTLLGRLGLLDRDGMPTWRTAFGLAFVAWVPPAILDLVQLMLQPGYPGWNYFRDPTVYTRYLVAIVAMVITERVADERLSVLLSQFSNAGLLDRRDRERYRFFVTKADRLASWSIVEAILLLLAVLWSLASFYFVSSISTSGWEEWGAGTQPALSWAGTFAALVSNPIFLFLVLRWLWRFLVWTWLLFRVSRLSLLLVPMHPDRAGGLGFMALFPGIFSGFVFALSCVVSASMLKTMDLVTISQAFIWLGILCWVVLMALLFLGPLLVFTAPLLSVKEEARIKFGRLAQVHHRAFHARWVEGQRNAEELLGQPDPSSAADLNAIVETALAMRVIPLDLAAVLQILVAALAPFLVVVVSQIPITQLLTWMVSAIF